MYLIAKCNLVKTIFINYKVLPLRIACKLPIHVYGKAIFRSLSGEIILPGDIHLGIIEIGKTTFISKPQYLLHVDNKWHIEV